MRSTTSRVPFRSGTFSALLEDEGPRDYAVLGTTRGHETWVQAARAALKLADRRGFVVVNRELIERVRSTACTRSPLNWPEGTQHNKSRFFQSNNHMQCQACGHAIQKPFNWVPILAYGHSEKPTPCSLWVGRDCAGKLFGCKVEGDAIYPERQR